MSLRSFRFTKALLFSIGAIIVSSATIANEVNDLQSMVTQGSVKLDFRYRLELVDQAGFDEDATASTLRSRLSYASAALYGFSFGAEFDDLTEIGDDDYNSTHNGRVEYPVVADPEGTEVNQAWANYQGDGFAARYGRQRILHDDQRFVGGVAWRQNEQTYDGLRVQYGADTNLSFDYAYVYNVNRIFGPDDGLAQPADLSGDNHLARLQWQASDLHRFAVFGYWLDFDEERDYAPGKSVGNSTATYGLGYDGTVGPLALRVAYAHQSDAGGSALDYDADYFLGEGSVDIQGVQATIGYEVLAADNGVGFKTPLATLHKFQGWADLFLVTPADGIEDFYLGVSGKAGPVNLGAWYHEFDAEDSGADFGSEVDLVVTWPIHNLWSAQLKYANFDSEDRRRYSDTEKLWLTVNLKI